MKVLIIVFFSCAIIAVIVAALSKGNTAQPIESQPQPQKKERKKKQRVRSYDEHIKRMNKKKYLSEHSEYVYISKSEAQSIVGVQDQELIDGILDAILYGKEVVKLKRETYNKIKNGKILQDGDQPL